MHSEQIDLISAALAKAQGEMDHAAKGRQNPHLRNRYSTLADVLDACRDPLAKAGIAVIQQPHLDGDVVTVRTTLAHSSGQWFACELSAPIGDNKGVTRAQAIGSVITYLRRYGLSALAVIASDDDDDGNSGRRNEPQPKPAPPPAPVVVEAVPHWSEDERVEFCESLAKLDPPLDYNDVADWCESVSQPPPERLTPERRAKLLAHLTSEKGRAAVAAYLAARGAR